MAKAAVETLRSSGVAKAVGALVLSAAGISGIMYHEGTVNRVYLDPVSIPTVCVGHTATVTRADVGKVYSDARCAELLLSDTAEAQRAVRTLVTVPVTQAQYDALTSLVFNIGARNFSASTLLRRLNAGQCRAAAAEFSKWVFAKGQRLAGLVKRRADERAKFEADCP